MQMHVREPARVDTGCLASLQAQLGAHVAENVICHALEELGARLGTIEACYEHGDFDAMPRHLRGLVAISDQLGLLGLVSVAHDVLRCLDLEDGTALAATHARLLRQGEAALSAVWDFQDHAG